MLKFLAVTVLASLAFGGPVEKTEDFPLSLFDRIVGGEETDIKKVPYQISLRKNHTHHCGGSIISTTWIVTAAHCITDRNTAHYTVYAGSSHRNEGGSEHSVDAIIVHAKYESPGKGDFANDIALIHVIDSFVLDSTRKPIELFNAGEESPVGSEAIITGWGITVASKSPEKPMILRLVRIPIINKEVCNYAHAKEGGIAEHQICTQYPGGGKDSCRGDSGGPLAINGRLAGVVSWGIGCGRPDRPGVYTEIAGYRQWISKNTGI